MLCARTPKSHRTKGYEQLAAAGNPSHTKRHLKTEDQKMSDVDLSADVEFARTYREVLSGARQLTQAIVDETDKTAVWLVGLASAVLLGAVAKPMEAHHVLGGLYFWAILLLWLSILMGVTYKVSNLTLTARAVRHFFSLEAALAGHSVRGNWTEDSQRNIQQMQDLVSAYTGLASATEIDLSRARREFRTIRTASHIVSTFFGCSAAFFAWATFLLAYGLWTH